MITMPKQKSKDSNTIQQQKVVEVLFTEKDVYASEVAAAVPKGCRMARPDEVALAYKERPEFKKALDTLTGMVWVDQIGLDSSGTYKTDENGKFVKITEAVFKRLGAENRSRHYPGTSRVCIKATTVGTTAGGCT